MPQSSGTTARYPMLMMCWFLYGDKEHDWLKKGFDTLESLHVLKHDITDRSDFPTAMRCESVRSRVRALH